MSQMEIDEHGNKYWRNSEGYIHREDGPAIAGANGSKFWFIDGKPHREDGPSSEYASGKKEWYINGKLHRLDGPARSKEWYINGTKKITEGWFIGGEKYSFDEWLDKLQISDEEKIMLCLKWK